MLLIIHNRLAVREIFSILKYNIIQTLFAIMNMIFPILILSNQNKFCSEKFAYLSEQLFFYSIVCFVRTNIVSCCRKGNYSIMLDNDNRSLKIYLKWIFFINFCVVITKSTYQYMFFVSKTLKDIIKYGFN